MKEKTKPKYNVIQNIWWITKIAWNTRRRVLLFCILAAGLEVVYNLTQLYIAPEILTRVEQHEPLGNLLAAIAFFTLALFFAIGAKKYISYNALFPRVEVRSSIISMLGWKNNTTSYPNTLKADFIKLREKASMACDSNNKAAEHIWETLTCLLQNIGGFAVYLTILSGVSPVLLAVVVITCFAGFLVSRRVNNWQFTQREQEEKYYAKKRYIRDKAESVELAKDVRIFGLQNWFDDMIDSVHNAYLDYLYKVERKLLLADMTEAVLAMARNGIAYVYLLNMALKQNLTVPQFLLYFTAVSTFTTWVMGILQHSVKLHQESLDLSQLREFLEYPDPFRFEGGVEIPKAERYELKLENVSYRYPGADHDTIHNLNLTVHGGEKLAIVGLNGAGKTTVVKLLCGLFDPTEGRVLLNGQDVRTFNRRDYYGLISAVFQEYSLLDVTVEENVSLSADHIDEQKVAACLEKAGLTQAIAALPKGTKTHVGRDVYLDGVLFSGGQTQRLMLARALYKDGPILMLDEPTAALDPIAENDIYMKYNDMTAGKTSIFISHRLASTRFCDRIIFLADGDIAEEGTHEGLLARGGAYAKLFEMQSRYYQEGKDF